MQTMYMRLDLYALTSKFVNYLGLKCFIETIWNQSFCVSVCMFDYLYTYPAYSAYICVPMGRNGVGMRTMCTASLDLNTSSELDR